MAGGFYNHSQGRQLTEVYMQVCAHHRQLQSGWYNYDGEMHVISAKERSRTKSIFRAKNKLQLAERLAARADKGGEMCSKKQENKPPAAASGVQFNGKRLLVRGLGRPKT